MSHPLNDATLDQLFREARTVHAFKPEPISDETLHQLYDLLNTHSIPATAPRLPLRQCSVFGQPQPTVDAVWAAWESLATPVLCR